MRRLIILLLTAFGCCMGCKKETAVLQNADAAAYYPLQMGKKFVYRLDSTINISFGSALATKSYLLKDSIINTFIDNNGRTSYTVYRYLTDTLLTQPWQYKSAYYITPAGKNIEVTDDNNLRFIKLVSPVAAGITWQGNNYIDTKSLSSVVRYLDRWDYTYQDINQSYNVLNGTLDSTITVMQQNETIPEGPFDPNNYQQRNYSIEVYAKGIGLIYKDFLHWEYQIDPPPAHYTDESYGIRLNLVSYD